MNSKHEVWLSPSPKGANYLLKCVMLALLGLICGLHAPEAYAAKVKSQTVTITVNDQPLKSVLPLIEKQTGYLFVVNSNVDTDTKVSVSAQNKPVKEVLDKMFNGKDIFYAIEGHNIVLSKNKHLAAQAEAPDGKKHHHYKRYRL